MTAQVKTAINERQHAFRKGDELRWRYLRNKVIRCIAKAKMVYYNTRVSNLKANNPSAWYRQIKILTQGNSSSPPITNPGINNNCVEFKEAANAINNHFISIASDLPPLDRKILPAFPPSPSICPDVQQWELVYSQLQRLNIQKAGTTNDLPVRIIKEFAYELSKPLTDLINVSFKQGEIQAQWKSSQVTPIPKSQPPTIGNLRPIALTSHFARNPLLLNGFWKTLEKVLTLNNLLTDQGRPHRNVVSSRFVSTIKSLTNQRLTTRTK